MGLLSAKRKVKLGYLDDKPIVYKASTVTFPAVTSEQFVNEISNSCGVTPAKTKAVIDALNNRCCHYIEIGHPVQLGSFGTLKPVANFKIAKKLDEVNMEQLKIKKVRFYPGERLRETMRNITIQEAGSSLDAEE